MVHWNQYLFSTVLTEWPIAIRIYVVQYWQADLLEPISI